MISNMIGLIYIMMALLLLFLPAISAYILPHLQLQTRYPRIFKVYSTNTNIISSSSALEWVDSKDIKNNEIKITINPSSGICIAKSALKDSDIMFSLPQGLCLDPEKAERKFGSVISASQLRTGSLGMVSLLLLSEVSLESESKYSAYIRSLPTKTPGILGFPINELKEFVASTTRNIRSQLAAIEEDIETILSNKQLLSMFPDGSIDRERLKWAIGTTKARSVYIDGSPVLVPGMDFIPFDPLCDREPQSVSAGVFGGKVVKVRSDREYAAGAPVFMSYGLKSSAECVEDHGFCPVIEPLDDSCCEISVSVTESDKYVDDKIEILERAGFRKEARFDLEAREDTDIDPDLIRFLRLKLIAGRDSFILESCFSRTAFETLAEPFSKDNEIKVHEYILQLCSTLLESIESVSTHSQDTAVLAPLGRSYSPSDFSTQTPAIALALLRRQECAALRNTIRKMEAELILLKGMDMREYYQERRLKQLDLLRPLEETEIRSPDDRSSSYDSEQY